MEFYLVENSVQVVEIEDAFQRTDDYGDFLSEIDEFAKSEEDYRILILEDFSVELNSSSFGDTDNVREFAENINVILKREEQAFGDVKLELILFNWKEEFENKDGDVVASYVGYLLLSDMKKGNPKEETVNIIERLEHAFGKNEAHFEIELCFVHLPTRDAPISWDSGITLKAANLKYCSLPGRIGGEVSVGSIPDEIEDFWDEKAGFIQAKLNVKMKADEDGINYLLKFGHDNSDSDSTPNQLVDLNWKMLQSGILKDLEIGCQNGAVVRCHSAFLAANSNKLEKMFKERRIRQLVINMSEEGVKGFLEWVYCKQVTKAEENSNLAMELLKAGRKYEVKKLESEMEKLLMSKGTKDLEYFNVGAALNLYRYVKDDGELKHLRDKAVRVLKTYIKTDGEKLVESVEYQNFFRNDPQEAMKLGHLYGLL